jgi:ribosome-associated protein
LIEGRERIVNRIESAEQEGADLTKHIAQTAARAAAGMWGRDTTIIDLKGLISYADYFVVTGAQTERQTRRIAEEVLEKMREEGYRPTSKRYDEGSAWISLDFLDVVVHVLTDEARDYYRLESLWRAAPQEKLEEYQLAQQMMQQQQQG